MMLLLAVLMVLVPACRPPDGSQTTPTLCGIGLIRDGSACVPASCGTGRWGDLPVDESTVHVDAAAPDGGDGTESAPYATIQRGLNRAGLLGGGLVAVAAGTYPETLEFTADHADVRLAGRCRELVILDASVGDEETPGIGIDAGYATVGVSGLTVRDSSHTGMDMWSGVADVRDFGIVGSAFAGVYAQSASMGGVASLAMEDSIIEGNTSFGLIAFESPTEITLRNTTVRDTYSDEGGEGGWGVWLQDGAAISAEGCLFEGNHQSGLFAAEPGTRVTLRDTIIRDTQPDRSGAFGQGIGLQNGATLSAESCVVEGNTGYGLTAVLPGTLAALRDTIIRDTRSDEDGDLGWGIDVWDGATLSLDGCLVEGNTVVGLGAFDPGTQVILRDTAVRETLPDANGDFGRGVAVGSGAMLSAEGCLFDRNGSFGISVEDGATLFVESSLIERNMEVGLWVTEPESRAILADVTVRDTQANADGLAGRGIEVQEGATLHAEGCHVEGNAEVGVLVANPGTMVALRDTTVQDTRPGEDGTGGRGIEVYDGATLDAVGCLIAANTENGLVATDADTEVRLRDTTVRDTRPRADGDEGVGIVVQAGAILSAEGCLIHGNTMAGLIASRSGTEVRLRDTVVRDTQPRGAGDLGEGLVIQEGARAILEDCLVDGNTEIGVAISNPFTDVTLRDTIVAGTDENSNGEYGWGIAVNLGAALSAEGCLIEGNTSVGLEADFRGTVVALRDTTVRDTRSDAKGEHGRGIDVSDGASLSAEDCLLDGNTELGLHAGGAGTYVTLRGTTVRNTRADAFDEGGWGIQVSVLASLSMEDSLVEGNDQLGLLVINPGTHALLKDTTVRDSSSNAEGKFGRGVEVSGGATLSVEGCLIDGNSDAGLWADGVDTRVTFQDSTVSDTRMASGMYASSASGVIVLDRAELSADRLASLSNQGPGVLVIDGGSMKCAECRITDNQFAGAAAVNGGALTITDSVIERTSPGINLLGGVGVYAWPWIGAPPAVTLANSIILDNPIAGVWLIGNGIYVIEGNTISGSIGEPYGSGFRCGDAILAMDGVVAWNGATGLLLQDNVLRDAQGAGLFLDDASALMSGDTYVDNALDLVVQDWNCDTLPTGYAEAPRRDLCPFYEHPTCYAEFFFVALPAEPVEADDGKAGLLQRPPLAPHG